MKRLTVDVQVVNGERPLLPLLLMPTKVCISEMQLLPLDMMRIEGRYREDEFVTMSLVASKGQLLLEEQRIPEICKHDFCLYNYKEYLRSLKTVDTFGIIVKDQYSHLVWPTCLK